jgi:hypothetical protein
VPTIIWAGMWQHLPFASSRLTTQAARSTRITYPGNMLQVCVQPLWLAGQGMLCLAQVGQLQVPRACSSYTRLTHRRLESWACNVVTLFSVRIVSHPVWVLQCLTFHTSSCHISSHAHWCLALQVSLLVAGLMLHDTAAGAAATDCRST